MVSDNAEMDKMRLHNELEAKIKEINREQISQAAGVVGHKEFIQVAEMVACLRARYLSDLLSMAKKSGPVCIDTNSALKLKALREAYQETLVGFDALEHALKQGYVEFAE